MGIDTAAKPSLSMMSLNLYKPSGIRAKAELASFSP